MLKAAPGADCRYRPPPIHQVVETILREKPSLVCAPHVETSIGMILPRDYCMAVAAAAKEVGAVFCLDGIASGNAWVNLNDGGPDVYLTAPQKGWTGPACVGIVMMSDRAKAIMKAGPPSTSFSVNLDKVRGGGGRERAGLPPLPPRPSPPSWPSLRASLTVVGRDAVVPRRRLLLPHDHADRRPP